MRFMKGLTAIALGVALLCPMTAYAAQTEEALALYKQVEEKNKNLTDMNAYYDFKIKVGGDMLNPGEAAMDMRMEMNVKMSHITDPSLMRYMTYSRLTGPDNEQIIYSTYYVDGYCYMDMMGQKIKYPMDMASIMDQTLASSNAFDVSADIMKDMDLWDEGDNKVIGFTIDDRKMNEYMQTILGSTGLAGIMDGITMNLSNMKGEYVVDPNGNMIKMRLKMDMDMTMGGQTITMNLDGDVGIADPGQPVDIPAPNAGEYTDITAAASN